MRISDWSSDVCSSDLATGSVAPLTRASSSARPRSLRIQSTAKPKSNSSFAIVPQRLRICQLAAEPPETASNILSVSSFDTCAKSNATDRPWTDPDIEISEEQHDRKDWVRKKKQ